jgi:ribosomal protein S27E
MQIFNEDKIMKIINGKFIEIICERCSNTWIINYDKKYEKTKCPLCGYIQYPLPLKSLLEQQK